MAKQHSIKKNESAEQFDVSGRGKAQSKEAPPPTDIASVRFDAASPEFVRSWHTNASAAICLNAYPNGITFSVHRADDWAPEEEQAEQPTRGRAIHPSHFNLRIRETKSYLLPPGKYSLHREDYAHALERRLSQLRERGVLSSAVVYFGVTSDPFSSFHKKFDVTMACLELLSQYKPRRVILQTRSPMVISALPTLKMLGERAVVTMPIETRLESAIQRYTPGMPKISERLVAADGLRRQGIVVNLSASPILPYGEVYRDAWDFADMLDKHSDFITLGCLASGGPGDESALKALPIARRLVSDKNYRWLRPHAYRHLYYALKVLAPEKLLLPLQAKTGPAQLSLFAA